MAFQTQDGTKSYGSRFRQSRYDRENSNPDSGPRSQAKELSGKSGDGAMTPNADSRLHNNPHPEKFNTPLSGPKASVDSQQPGDEQMNAREQHTVTCPHCGGEVSTGGASDAQGDAHDNGQSSTEQDVQHGDVAKGVWKPGQREHPDADGDFDFEPDVQ